MNNNKFEKFGIGIGALIIGTLACCFVVAIITIVVLAVLGPAIGIMFSGMTMDP